MTTKGRFSNPFSAVITGVFDVFRSDKHKNKWKTVPDMTGLTCLVTGANSGLGFGISVLLARKGAHVIMACRKAYPDAIEKVRQLSGSRKIESRLLDLTNKTSIVHFVQGLKNDGIKLDVSIHNAGVTTPKARQLANGLDEMFMVNYLSKFILINALLDHAVIDRDSVKEDGRARTPRIIIVSSDSHQGASAIDWDELGKYESFAGPNRAVSLYSYNKIVLNTMAVELSRKLKGAEVPDVQIHVICPGPVNTNIIRHAPGPLRVVLRLVFYLFFKSPVEAAKPVIYLAATEDMAGKTNTYLHMWDEKQMDEKCYDPEAGSRLWKISSILSSGLD